jgi:hypothetical protein
MFSCFFKKLNDFDKDTKKIGKRWKLKDGSWKFYKNAEKLS